MPWAHTHATRSSALKARKCRSHCHKDPSYKVHNHPYTRRHIYIYIYIHTCIIHNAITQSRKVNRHCQCPKGMAQLGTGNVKQTLPYLGNAAQVMSKKEKGYKERGNTNNCSREKAKREGERSNHWKRLGLLIYWTLPFVGLCLLACILSPFAYT